MGWRPEAKRLLLLMTDQPSHLALDSRLAGIVVPHDGRCHLENNVYTGSTRMVRSWTNTTVIRDTPKTFLKNPHNSVVCRGVLKYSVSVPVSIEIKVSVLYVFCK